MWRFQDIYERCVVIIVVIALYLFYNLDVNEIWVEYGVGQHKRWLTIHENAKC